MREAEFLHELEARLAENRRLAKERRWPVLLRPLISYLGFHTFRVLLLVSLGLVLLAFSLDADGWMWLGTKLFLWQ